MADENIRTTLQFQTDITDFKAAMQEARRAVNLANSEFEAVSSGMDDWAGSTDGLSAKLRQQSTVIAAQERQLDVLVEAYKKTVEEQGENSAAAQDLLVKINKQQAAINKSTKEYNSYAEKLEEVEQSADGAASGIEKAGGAVKDAGDDAEESADGWSIAKDVIADFVSNAISSAIDALVSVAEATREYRREMAQLSQNAADSGHGIDDMKETLSGVAAVTGDAGAAMEGLNMLMASGFDTDGVNLAADALAGAALKFDGVNFEGIAEGLQETLSTGAAAGPFAEVIERSGGNLEAFNEGLAACTTEAEKQQYVLKWLADSGLKSVHDSYVQNNADLVEAEKAQFRYNDAMAAVGAAVEPINTALSNLGATILEKVAPIVEKIVGFVLDNLPVIEPLVIGIATALGVLAVALGIQKLITGVQKAFALLNTTMLANPIVLIVALIAGLVAALVALWNKSEAFRNFWKNLWAGIKNIVASVAEWFGKTAANIAKFFVDAWGKIKNAFSPAAVRDFFSGVWSKITGVFSSVGSWFGNIFRNAWSGITNAFSNVGSFFADIWAKIKGAFSIDGMLSIGKNLVSGLWEGLKSSIQWLKDKITGWVGDVLGFLKGLFGINSPSKETAWQGEMLVEGYARSLLAGRQKVAAASEKLRDSALDGMAPKPGQPGPASGGGTGGKTIIFNQTNNSPRALSRREIYRRTHNALSAVGGG